MYHIIVVSHRLGRASPGFIGNSEWAIKRTADRIVFSIRAMLHHPSSDDLSIQYRKAEVLQSMLSAMPVDAKIRIYGRYRYDRANLKVAGLYGTYVVRTPFILSLPIPFNQINSPIVLSYLMNMNMH